jgi:hypothetical protein
MDQIPRHQCLVYDGAPSRQLPMLAEMLRQKLGEGFRCVFLNSPPMVAGIRSSLSAAGIDLAGEIERGNLRLLSERDYLVQGHFDPERMIFMLNDALTQALVDGYRGLWATGDMTWELGPKPDFAKLAEYEWKLEEFFRYNPGLSGVCQYHADTLPHEVMRQGLASHPALFINETLSRINPHYLPQFAVDPNAPVSAELDRALARYLAPPGPRSD